jgi:hypothetical protein
MIHLMLAVVLPLAMVGQDEANSFQRDPAKRKTIQTLIHSTRWQEREKGFRLAKSFGCAEAEDRATIFEIIRTENDFIDAHVRKRTSPLEGWGDPYYSDLLGHAFSCFKVSPRPAWFRLLAQGGYNGDSPFARELAHYTGENLAWLVKSARMAESRYTRSNLNGLLVWTLTYNPDWPVRRRSEILATVQYGLTDSESEALSATAFFVAISGLPESREMLARAKARLLRGPKPRTLEAAYIDRIMPWIEKSRPK